MPKPDLPPQDQTGQSTREPESAAEVVADNDAVRLLDRALGLRMYGEGAPGNSDTWSAWDRDCEGFLRDRLCAEKGHAPEGNCCPAWVIANG